MSVGPSIGLVLNTEAMTGKAVAFSDLACDLGFSDQSHFLREFKKLVSVTPLDYLHQVKQETYVSRLRYF
ncbi:helix-turn-helix domain-containing protein [Marinomonas vulgaris]|uniref:helix-turn-helix domain-containing protein n=1 Tax=Marinomonas vulgaris TaxID=2823372 RepID=UPI001F264174|nr:AraC family transcriptional regulator [Marinomonas vulgaris]